MSLCLPRERHCHVNELEPPFFLPVPRVRGRAIGTPSVSRSRAARHRRLHHITTPLRDNAASPICGANEQFSVFACAAGMRGDSANRHVVAAVRLASCRAAARVASGLCDEGACPHFQICRTRSPAGSAFARAADCRAQTCIRWTSPSFCPAARIAAVSARCTG